MPDPFIGEIRMFGFGFAPQGWALCNGQLLPIAQNAALFSLLGTTYGGDGQTTFALPDLRSRVPVGQGQGPGLSNYGQGQAGGAETVTLAAAQMPGHTHPVEASTSPADSGQPAGRTLARSAGHTYTARSGTSTAMNAAMLGHTGASAVRTVPRPAITVTCQGQTCADTPVLDTLCLARHGSPAACCGTPSVGWAGGHRAGI